MGEITNFNRNLGTKQVCFEVHVQVWSGGMLLYSPTHIGKTTSANRWMCTICVKKFENSFQNHSIWNFFYTYCVPKTGVYQKFWYQSGFDIQKHMYQKFLICIIKFWYVSLKKYISEISDVYQKKLICIRNFWYVSEISDMYHKILICIIKFWYVSEISDTYFFKMHQKFLISFKNKQQMHIVRHTFKKITWAAGSRQP